MLEIFLKTTKQATILAIVGEVISITVGLWLTWWAWDFTKYSLRVWKESPTLYLPTFYMDMALFVGLVLMMIYTFTHLIKHIRQLSDPEKPIDD